MLLPHPKSMFPGDWPSPDGHPDHQLRRAERLDRPEHSDVEDERLLTAAKQFEAAAKSDPEATAPLKELVRRDRRVLQEPRPSVLYSEVAGANVTLTLRYWTRPRDYTATATELNQHVRAEMEQGRLALA